MFTRVLVATLTVSGALASLYGAKSHVQELTAKNFQEKVTNSNEIWVVEFYADWCGHCKQFAPEYEKAAAAMSGMVNYGAVSDESLMGQFGVKGFPTVKFFGDNKQKPLEYSGQRQGKELVNYAFAQLRKIAQDRLSGKSKAGKAGKGSKQESKSEAKGSEEDVVVLTDSNFNKLVMQDEKSVWFIEFYAPWCGHCKALTPHWNAAATEMKGKVKFGKIDATAESVLAKRFQVQGFPSIKLFPAGKKTDVNAVDYQEARDTKSIAAFAEKFFTMTREADQLMTEESFRENCENKVCVIAFLPHILDSQADGRNAYIKSLNTAIRASAGVPVHYFWSQGGDQFEFEESLRLQFGFPALVAVHLSKGHYGIHRGGFDEENIRSFLSGLMARKVTLDPLPKDLPKISKTPAWDGKDAVIEEEEDL